MLRERNDVRAPLAVLFHPVEPVFQCTGESGQVEEVVLSFFELGRHARHLRDRVDEVLRIKLIAAVITLVTARACRLTNWAGALNVAIRQGVARLGVDRHRRRLHQHVAVIAAPAEQILNHLLVIRGGGARE